MSSVHGSSSVFTSVDIEFEDSVEEVGVEEETEVKVPEEGTARVEIVGKDEEAITSEGVVDSSVLPSTGTSELLVTLVASRVLEKTGDVEDEALVVVEVPSSQLHLCPEM